MLKATIAGEGCRVVISVVGYEYDTADDYHDANWLAGFIEVELDGYRARQSVSWQAAEIRGFARALERLGDELTGTAEMHHLEDEVELRVSLGAGRGEIEGAVRRHARPELTFEEVPTDQTLVASAARQVRAIAEAFPVRLVDEPRS